MQDLLHYDTPSSFFVVSLTGLNCRFILDGQEINPYFVVCQYYGRVSVVNVYQLSSLVERQ